MPKSIEAQFLPHILPRLSADGPGAAVGVFEDGRARYWRGFGRQSLGGAPITPRSLFDLGSNAKQFVGALILLLEQEGKLSLEDEVQRLLPELPRYGRPMRLRHLLHHSSGIRECGNLEFVADRDNLDWSRSGYLRCAFRQKELNFPVGSRHFYSNTNYVLLAEAASRASGKSISALIRERLFRPAGMRGTYITPLEKFRDPRFAEGYQQAGKEWVRSKPDFSDHHTGATGIYSDLNDFNLWIQSLSSGSLGGRKLAARMMKEGKLDSGKGLGYGAGVFVGSLGRELLISHGGYTAGWSTQYHWLPKRKLLVACFANHPGINVWGLVPELTRYVAGIALPKAKAAKPAAVVTPAVTKEPVPAWEPQPGICEGRYWSEEGLCGFMIARSAGKLFLDPLRSPPEPGMTFKKRRRLLSPIREGRFGLQLYPPSTELQLEDMSQGRASACRLHFGEGSRIFSLRFQRVIGRRPKRTRPSGREAA